MHLLLVRHGNTFEADQTPVQVGRAEDIPLVDKGRLQASELGQVLKPIASRIKGITAAGLKRTTEHAHILQTQMGWKGVIASDDRLAEIDYGSWGGKSTPDLEAEYGKAVVDAWGNQGVWPENCDWSPSFDTIKTGITAISFDLTTRLQDDEAWILVSSNGVLRFFLELVEGAFAEAAAGGTLKMGTGNISHLHYSSQYGWTVKQWNCKPSVFNVNLLRLEA